MDSPVLADLSVGLKDDVQNLRLPAAYAVHVTIEIAWCAHLIERGVTIDEMMGNSLGESAAAVVAEAAAAEDIMALVVRVGGTCWSPHRPGAMVVVQTAAVRSTVVPRSTDPFDLVEEPAPNEHHLLAPPRCTGKVDRRPSDLE